MGDVPKKEEVSQEALPVKEQRGSFGSGFCCLQGMARKAGPGKKGQRSAAFPAEEAEG